jgi:hypothetical protein
VSFSPSFTIENLATLVAGLLASGHYTHKGPWTGVEGSADPELIEYDAGVNWKEDGYHRRFQRRVIDDAESLMDDIIKLAYQREEQERHRRHGQ